MEQNKSIEYNTLITEFMIGKRLNKVRSGCIKIIKDYCAWHTLMPVVEKIESLGFIVTIHAIHTTITAIDYNNPLLVSEERNNRIEGVYASVITFIEWYNSSK